MQSLIEVATKLPSGEMNKPPHLKPIAQNSCNGRGCQITANPGQTVLFLQRSRYNGRATINSRRIARLLRTGPMNVSLLRLGDEVDDYCPRCKLLLNHAVAGMMGTTVVKVVCQTCHTEHPFKNAEVPPKKKSGPRATLMDQVLAKVAPPSQESAPEPEEKAVVVEETPEPTKKKSSVTPARYITRHAVRPPRGQR